MARRIATRYVVRNGGGSDEGKDAGVARFRRQRQTDAVEVTDDAAALAAEIETARAVVRRYRSWTDIRFGAGTRCPGCGTVGFVVSVNVVVGSSDNACLECQRDWRLTRRALDAVADEQRAAARLRLALLPDVPEPLAAAAGPDAASRPAIVFSLPEPTPLFVAATDDLDIEATPAVLDAFLRAPSEDVTYF